MDSLAPSAKIGGMVATNCSGTNAVKYGTMRDWVVNLTVVLADGSVIKTRRRPRKSSAGYFLNGLFVGSEGTLGIVTEATLKLAVIPEHLSVAVVSFPTLRDAVSAATTVIRNGVPVAAVELMDDVQIRIVNEGGETGRKWTEAPTLFFKFSGSQAMVDDNIRAVQKAIRPFSPSVFEWAKDRHEQELLWSARKQSLWSLLALRREGEVLCKRAKCYSPGGFAKFTVPTNAFSMNLGNTDVAVPLSRLADIIEKSSADIKELGLKATIKGHVGDGNFHENITYTPSDPEETARVRKAVKNMVANALEMEGTCTGEHGIGLGKKTALLQEVGADTILVMV
jgi:D-lactate dehydrogenase (cytochrome)